MGKQERTMVGTNHTSIAQTDARKARAPRVMIVDEVTGVDKERRCNADLSGRTARNAQ
jgi:hypothetical protein